MPVRSISVQGYCVVFTLSGCDITLSQLLNYCFCILEQSTLILANTLLAFLLVFAYVSLIIVTDERL